jgi:hypothetical protein
VRDVNKPIKKIRYNQLGAYHERVATSTGSLYVAYDDVRELVHEYLEGTCIPLNSIVAVTYLNFQVVDALSSLTKDQDVAIQLESSNTYQFSTTMLYLLTSQHRTQSTSEITS